MDNTVALFVVFEEPPYGLPQWLAPFKLPPAVNKGPTYSPPPPPP